MSPSDPETPELRSWGRGATGNIFGLIVPQNMRRWKEVKVPGYAEHWRRLRGSPLQRGELVK
jgi:hypothetical protein